MSASLPISPTSADAKADRAPQLLGSCIAYFIIPTLAVTLRFISRVSSRVGLRWDDWLILAALICGLMMSSVILWAVRDNYGKHTVLGRTSISTLHAFLKDQYAVEILYLATVGMVRVSILALYMRVFPRRASWRYFTWVLYSAMALNVAWSIIWIFLGIFDCDPVQGYWLFETNPTCFDVTTQFAAAGSTNIVLDFTTLLLPALVIRTLQLNLSQKIGVLCTFGIGAIATCAGIIRLVVVMRITKTIYTDPTWVLVDGGILCMVETGLAIVCACVPSWRPLGHSVRNRVSSWLAYTRSRTSSRSRSRATPGPSNQTPAVAPRHGADPDAIPKSLLQDKSGAMVESTQLTELTDNTSNPGIKSYA